MNDQFQSGPAKGRSIWPTVGIGAAVIILLAIIGSLIFDFPELMFARYLGIGAALALAAMYAAWSVQVSNLRADAANAATAAQVSYSALKGSFDAYKLQVEQGISEQATIRANENLAALDRERALQAEADRFRAQAATATRLRNEASKALLDALANAPQTDVSPLDVGSREFFGRLRGQQLTARAPGD